MLPVLSTATSKNYTIKDKHLLRLYLTDSIANRTGVFTDTSCGKTDANHAVVVVGYGTLNGLNYWVYNLNLLLR